MITTISMTKMSAADAVTVNEKIQAAVADCVSSFDEATVGQPVIDGADLLATMTAPLNKVSKMDYEKRRQIDTAADRCLGSIYSVCVTKQEAYDQSLIPLTDTQQAEWDSARLIQETFFPRGKGFLKGRWSEQYGVTEMILERAGQPENVSHLERLGLADSVDLLGKIQVFYGTAMGYSTVVADDEDSPLNKWHEALESYLAAVIFTQRQNKDLKARLTAPYETMAEAVRSANRKPRGAKMATEKSKEPSPA